MKKSNNQIKIDDMKTNYRNLDKNMPYTKALKALKISYLGKASKEHSAKLDKSYKKGVLTYGLYLAPWNLSSYQVCPGGRYCHEFCLNGSGVNKADELARGRENSLTNISRIKKTRLFFENRALFMKMLIHEIRKAERLAKALGMPLAIRINCTSDLSPELFVDEESKLNILQIFSHLQFYDYTKVPNRISLLGKYKNYDLTFSYDGHNMEIAKSFLEHGGRVAVVFYRQDVLPTTFAGYKVIDGNAHDMRYLDEGRCVVGLYYHVVGNNYKMVDGKRVYIEPSRDFVIYPNNALVEY